MFHVSPVCRMFLIATFRPFRNIVYKKRKHEIHLYKELKMSHAPQSSEESTDSEDGTFSTVKYNEGLAPYRFEPERNSSTSGSSSDSDSNNGHGSEAPARVGNKNWCDCASCNSENREIDALCCRELNVTDEMFEGKTFLFLFYNFLPKY